VDVIIVKFYQENSEILTPNLDQQQPIFSANRLTYPYLRSDTGPKLAES